MCLAYPGRVLSSMDGTARVEVRGRVQDVVLAVLDGDPPATGDWLLVQSGIALARIAPAEAAERGRLLDQLEGSP